MLKNLQNQLNNIKKGDKITMGYIDGWAGNQLLKCKFKGAKINSYAQYSEVLFITVTPFKKRSDIEIMIKPTGHLTVWEGWHDLEEYNLDVEEKEGYKITRSKFSSFNISYFENLYQYENPLLTFNSKQDEINRYIITDQNIIDELETVAAVNKGIINENYFNKYDLVPRHITETFKSKYTAELNY